MKKVTIIVEDIATGDIETKVVSFEGDEMPEDLDVFISEHVGERTTREERR